MMHINIKGKLKSLYHSNSMTFDDFELYNLLTKSLDMATFQKNTANQKEV